MASNFGEWKTNLPKLEQKLRNSLRATASLELQGNMPKVKFNEHLMDFARWFVPNVFIEKFMIPAFRTGAGIPGFEGFNGNAYKYAPHIEVGKGRAGITYKRHEGRLKKNTFEAAMDEALALAKEAKTDKAREKAFAKYQKMQERAMELERKTGTNQEEAADRQDVEELLAKWKRGMEDMLTIMTTVGEVRQEGNQIVIGIGPMVKLLSLLLNSYSVTQGRGKGSSKYNSFFYAAEFGTGIAENVGGTNWVRTHDQGSHLPHKKADGQWWYGTPRGDGTWYGGLFSGQRGLHFLYDPQTREPRAVFGQWITANFKTEFIKYMRDRGR